MENPVTHEELDLSKETSEARQAVIIAAVLWMIALITLLMLQYPPPGKSAEDVNVVVYIFSRVGIWGGMWHTAGAIFHGSTVLVMRVSAVWRNPVQIAIALLVPAILSLYFLQHGLPKWFSIEDMLQWWNCILLLFIAFVSLACSGMLNKVVPMRGFLMSAFALFTMCFVFNMLTITAPQPRSEPIGFVEYLVCVAVSYGAMCFHLFKRTRGNHRRGTQLSLWD